MVPTVYTVVFRAYSEDGGSTYFQNTRFPLYFYTVSQLIRSRSSYFVTDGQLARWILTLWGALVFYHTICCHSSVQGPQNSWTHLAVSFETTGFPFCCLLWLAGLRWRYSNLPPHGDQRVMIWRNYWPHIFTFTSKDIVTAMTESCQI
jgi:hypothetical protein